VLLPENMDFVWAISISKSPFVLATREYGVVILISKSPFVLGKSGFRFGESQLYFGGKIDFGFWEN